MGGSTALNERRGRESKKKGGKVGEHFENAHFHHSTHLRLLLSARCIALLSGLHARWLTSVLAFPSSGSFSPSGLPPGPILPLLASLNGWAASGSGRVGGMEEVQDRRGFHFFGEAMQMKRNRERGAHGVVNFEVYPQAKPSAVSLPFS